MILHICARGAWRSDELYRVDSLDAEGFIHCSDPGSVHLPANRFYADQDDLVLLEIDPAALDVPVRWEPGSPPIPDGPWFPHVYGPINPQAVVAVHDFPRNADGVYELPAGLARR